MHRKGAGVRTKTAQLYKLISDTQPSAVILQETNLDEEAKWRLARGYNCIRQHRTVTRSAEAGKAGLTHGGALMLIHVDLNYERITDGILAAEDNTTEFVAGFINIPGKRPVRFVNIYVLPIQNREEDQRTDKFGLVLGQFSASDSVSFSLTLCAL